MSEGTTIDLSQHKLSIQKNILTAKPQRRGQPAVTANLNDVIGVDRDTLELKFGQKMFSKYCKDISIISVVNGSRTSHILKATIVPPLAENKESRLTLDGNLQITIPPPDEKYTEECSFLGIKCGFC